MAVSFVGLGFGALALAWRKAWVEDLALLVILGAGVAIGGGALYAATKKPSGQVEPRDREAEDDPVARFQPNAASPFRQHIRNARARIAPRVSASATAAAVGAAFVSTAVLFPVGLKLPR